MCVITLHEDEEGGRRSGNGREVREAAMEGWATAVRGAAAGVLSDGRERERRLGRFAARPAGLAASEVIPGSAAPWIRARYCRAKIGGAAQAFGRTRAIGAAKSVSLKKRVLDLN